MNSSKAAAKSSEPASPGGRWALDVQVSGEAASAKVKRDDVVLVVVTGPEANPADIRERARELLEDAHDGVPPGAAGRGIPPVMQRVIRSLLAWAEEANDGARDAAWWAIAFMHSPTAPMLVHVGGEEPRVLSASGTVTPQSNLLRGKNGVQVRAMGLRPGVLPTLSVTWATDPRDLGGAAVQADWQLEPRDEEPEDAPEVFEPPVMRIVEVAPEPVTESAVIPSAPATESVAPPAQPAAEPTPPAADTVSPTQSIITHEERRMLETIYSRPEPAEPKDEPPPEPPALMAQTFIPEREGIDSAPSDEAPKAESSDQPPRLEMTSFADAVEEAPATDSPLWDEPAATNATVTTVPDEPPNSSLIEAILADVDELPGDGLVVSTLDAQMEAAARVATPAEIEATPPSATPAAPESIESIVLDESAMEDLDDEGEDTAEAEAAFSALFESAYESSQTATSAKDTSTEPAPLAAESKPSTPSEEPALTWLSSTPEGDAAEKPAQDSTIKVFEPWSTGGRTMRPARPLIIGPSKRHVTTAEPAADTTRQARPKRPRPQLVKLQRGASEAPPTTRPMAPAGPRPPMKLKLDPKQQKGLILLGALVVVGVVISALMMPGGGSSPGKKGAAQHPVDLGPTGADRVRVETTVIQNDAVVEAKGAQVWIDGHLRGSAPLNVQLNAGPHTIRVSRHGEDSPVKLVSMPGDQMQTLTFQLGAANDVPRLSLLNHEPPAMLDRVAAVVVYVDRVSDDDVEMWLNLRENGEWHNFPMALQAAPGGTVGVAVIPADRLRPPKAAPFYVSAKRKATGEEYYSEMQNPGTL